VIGIMIRALMCPLRPKPPLGTLLALFWIIVTILFFLGSSVAVFRTPRFPLAIGMVRTSGRSGLWITLVPALVGVVGVLFWTRRKLRAALLLAYSSFWSLWMLSNLPMVWNAKQSFCIRNFCIVTPWTARLSVMALATPFVLAAVSTGRATFRSRPTATGDGDPMPAQGS
jgi:hypothetical protein